MMCHGNKRNLFSLESGIRLKKQKDEANYEALVVHSVDKGRFFSFHK